MQPKRLELYSALSSSDCAARLSNAIDRDGVIWWSFGGSHPVAGRVQGPSFRIRKRISYRNSFQTFLTGSFQPQGAGTLIQGEFAMQGFTRAFIPLWFILGTIFFIVSLVSMLLGSSPRDVGPWIIVPPLMLVVGVVLVRFGRHLARDEARFLTDFLQEVLSANDNTRNA